MQSSRNYLQPLPILTSDVALFLDVDGTVVPLAETPDAVVVPHKTKEFLHALKDRLGGALALVSGRNIANLDRLFAPLTFSIAGQHGLERRAGDVITVSGSHNSGVIQSVTDELRGMQKKFPELLVEYKGLSVALHYRRAPELEQTVHQIISGLEARFKDEVAVQHGKMVVELKLPGGGKHNAIAEFMQDAPFKGRVPVFAGDDKTDEDGFCYVNGVGGISVKVGAGTTAASHRVENCEALLAWLGTIYNAGNTQ